MQVRFQEAWCLADNLLTAVTRNHLECWIYILDCAVAAGDHDAIGRLLHRAREQADHLLGAAPLNLSALLLCHVADHGQRALEAPILACNGRGRNPRP